jgi:dienelactone hydrolase
MLRATVAALVLYVHSAPFALAQEAKPDTSRGDRMIADYFRAETAKISDACLAEIKTLDDWNAKKGEYRRQLLEMLGLDPLPERTDLKATVTGRVEAEEFVVEKVHFQSRPGLYVTGNLYLPNNVTEPLPAILYVCGHGPVKKVGISYGNKVTYQHHGAWFARHGYVCLTIDTLQMGEIEGIHHGTHRFGMFWWLNRGYTPAGVEAWNCVRALDYLETRPEVDKTKFGVTDRSGGGAYSWWIAAIDERIKAAVPVAGITDLQNHVVDGCVEGHCDCMYMVNTYRWDYPQVAALVAPRPLLISNTDSDGIFPLIGVLRTFLQVRRIYDLHEPAMKGASANVALNISPGPHKDTQELQLHAFRWFDKHLKGVERLIEKPAVKFFEPEQLKVFKTLPADEINTKIHETFVAAADPAKVPADKAEWEAMREQWKKSLYEKSFRDSSILASIHSADPDPFAPRLATFESSAERDGMILDVYKYFDEDVIPAKLFILRRAGLRKAEAKVMHVLDEGTWREFAGAIHAGFGSVQKDFEIVPANDERWKSMKDTLHPQPWVMMYVTPRGIGPTAWDKSERKQVQNRRRFYLLGQTLDQMRVWEVVLAMEIASTISAWKDTPLWLQSHRSMGGVVLYAAAFQKDLKPARLDLYDLPKSHRDGPNFLNVSRYLDMPQAVAMAAERSKVVLYQDDDAGWEYPQAVAAKLGWDAKQIQIRRKPK